MKVLRLSEERFFDLIAAVSDAAVDAADFATKCEANRSHPDTIAWGRDRMNRFADLLSVIKSNVEDEGPSTTFKSSSRVVGRGKICAQCGAKDSERKISRGLCAPCEGSAASRGISTQRFGEEG